MKIQQLIICVFIAMLGIAMIIHSLGDWNVIAIISDIVGLILIVIGVFSVLLFFRKRNSK